ncbi:MAG: ECF transporter S component [Clostridia bacterium]|nr:ECF transporter S component [Clostridia bacterium]
MKKFNTRSLVMVAMLSAVATILMFIDFSVPFMPPFIKMEISEMPALIASFAISPLGGVLVCLIKNIINCLRTSTGCVGEFANFILGAVFAYTAGVIYKHNKNKMGALWGCIVGSVVMGLLSVPINYFITYPMYAKVLPLEAIIGMYKEIFGGVDGLLSCLVIFNLPYTIIKGLLDAIITFLIYKRISSFIKGEK